jgi:hypothetical protein
MLVIENFFFLLLNFLKILILISEYIKDYFDWSIILFNFLIIKLIFIEDIKKTYILKEILKNKLLLELKKLLKKLLELY